MTSPHGNYLPYFIKVFITSDFVLHTKRLQNEIGVLAIEAGYIKLMKVMLGSFSNLVIALEK